MDTIQQLTKEQREAICAEISAGVAPADAPRDSVERRIHEWQPQLIAWRKKGYTPEQIAQFLAHPKIGIAVSKWTVAKVLARANHANHRPAVKPAGAKPQAASEPGASVAASRPKS